MKTLSIAALLGCMVAAPAVATAVAGQDPGTLYIYRPPIKSKMFYASFWIDGQRLGQFKEGYFEISVRPGNHQLMAFWPPSDEKPFFEGNLKRRFMPMVRNVTVAPGASVFVRFDQPDTFERVSDAARARREMRRVERRQPEVASIDTTFMTEIESNAWNRCSSLATVEACTAYMEAYPHGAHATDARAIVTRHAEAKLAAAEAREAALPLQIRKDKYMVALTAALKQERYDEAVKHFEKLDALGVAMSPAFTFYYGEALLNTGKSPAALEKFYAYINSAGPDGEHYRRALQLSNEAEGR